MTAAAPRPLDFGGPVDHPFQPFESHWMDRPLVERFLAVAAEDPARLAVHDGETGLTYGALVALVGDLAEAIRETVPPSCPVGIALENGVRFPAAMLACLATGHPYVPLDSSFPLARLRLILDHSEVAALIGDPRAPGIAELAGALPVIPAVRRRPDAVPKITATSDDLAYVLYTSGTTGTPKGVFQNQRNLLHDVLQYSNAVHLGRRDVMTQLYSPSVNGAIRDIYGALLNGATLHIVDLRRHGLGRVRGLIQAERVTVYHSMPPVLRAFLRGLGEGEVLDSLRLIYLAGDRLFRGDLERFWPHLPPSALIFTGIGSTENATIYRHWFLRREMTLDSDLLPVGYAVAERPSMVVDAEGLRAPPGDIGEIVVTSRHMALGYWKDPELSARCFPSASRDPAARTFRTGDLGRETEDGLLHFVGRADRQVKVRGHRVELAAVEAALRACAGVRDAVVLARDGEMTGFVELEPGVAGDQVAAELRRMVAPALVPSRLTILPGLPLLANFKHDLAALEALQNLVTTPADEPVPPAEGYAAIVAAAWTMLLGATACRAGTPWGQAGGDSLKALELLMSLELALGRRLPVEVLTDAMTPATLAARLAELPPSTPNPGRDGPLVVFAPGWNGPDLRQLAFARGLEAIGPVDILAYEPPALPAGGCVFTALMAQLAAHVTARAAGKPVHLVGYSFGARVVIELAVRLGIGALGRVVVIDASSLGVIFRKTATRQSLRQRLRPWGKGLLSWLLAGPCGCLVARGLSATHRTRHRLLLPLVLEKVGSPPDYCPAPLLLIRTRDPGLIWSDLPHDLGWSAHCPTVEVAEIPDATHATVLLSSKTLETLLAGLSARECPGADFVSLR